MCPADLALEIFRSPDPDLCVPGRRILCPREPWTSRCNSNGYPQHILLMLWVSFKLHQQVDAIQMGTHNICFYKEVDKKYTGCNLKITELLDCGLTGVCVVIRSNTVLVVFS